MILVMILKSQTNTISEYFSKLRKIMQDYLLEKPRSLGSFDSNGNKKIVKIDEYLFFKRKYRRKRVIPQKWVLGILERDSKRCSFFLLTDRSRSTIISIILEIFYLILS
ncbi:hypothetical protein DMUE_5583 [Dictyocoela muelleri]|nr:hypothetical protein DMUE_5583 [Dictyocoela muelleri]